MTNKFYVYRFLDDKGNILYIGRTNDLERRINREHFSSNGHLSQECYNECQIIEFMEFDVESEMKIYEIYLINRYSPKYNVMENRNDSFTFNLEEHWTEYKNNDIMTKKEYKLYSYIIMYSDAGTRRMTTNIEALSEGIKIKNKKSVMNILESLHKKGYIYLQQFGRALIISHTIRDLHLPKEG